MFDILFRRLEEKLKLKISLLTYVKKNCRVSALI